MPGSPAQRLLLLALDGATWDVAEALIQEGQMPALAALREAGHWGVLRSTWPPITPPAFATLFTGVDPGHHGVYDFFGHDPADFLTRPPTTAADLRAPTFWSRCAAAGLATLQVHLPMTWPPESNLKLVVSGQPGATGVYPSQEAKALARVAPGHLRPARRRPWRSLGRAMLSAEEQRQAVIVHVARNHNWQVLGCCVKATDAVAHHAWSIAGGQISEALRAAYLSADGLLATLRDLAPDATVAVVSDHGHGPCELSFGLNHWLLAKGWLAVRPELQAALRSRWRYQALRARCRSGWECFRRLVDWPRTRAYGGTGTEQGIYLNLVGREPQGVVAPGVEAERLRQDIEAALAELQLPGGRRVDGRPGRPRESGPRADQGPELFLQLDGGRVVAREGLRPGPLFRRTPPGTGTHRPEGIFALAGPGVQSRGQDFEPAQMKDLAPTLLALVGLPSPSNWTGRCLRSVAALPPDRAIADGRGAVGREADEVDEARTRRELRGWGYVDE